MTDIDALLPCPFCGSDGAKLRSGAGYVWAQCHDAMCGMEGPIRTEERDAITAWNTRAPSVARAVSADIDALRATLAKANYTRLVADYIPAGECVPEGWRIHDFPEGTHSADFICGELDEKDAAAIVALHNAAPALLDELEALRRDKAALVEALREASISYSAPNLKLCIRARDLSALDAAYAIINRAALNAHGAA